MKCQSKLEGFRLLPDHDPRTLECELEAEHEGYCCNDVQYWPSSPLKVFTRKGRAYPLFSNDQVGIRLHGGFCVAFKGAAECMLRFKHPGPHQAKAKVWVDRRTRVDNVPTRN